LKKKLLAGIMALALCSTSIPQMIFAEEFTSGVLEETTPEETEEIPEVFTDENQAAAGDEIGGGYLNLARRKFQSLMMRVTTQQLLLTVVIQLLPVQ